MKKGDWGVLLLMGSILPVFRSGLRGQLTLWEFIINHTIWGPEVEYIPEEMLTSGGTTDDFL